MENKDFHSHNTLWLVVYPHKSKLLQVLLPNRQDEHTDHIHRPTAVSYMWYSVSIQRIQTLLSLNLICIYYNIRRILWIKDLKHLHHVGLHCTQVVQGVRDSFFLIISSLQLEIWLSVLKWKKTGKNVKYKIMQHPMWGLECMRKSNKRKGGVPFYISTK